MKDEAVPQDHHIVTRDELIGLLNEDLARESQAIISYVLYSQVL
jgi:bacterioferritin